MSQLILGTAEFNPFGYINSPSPSLKEIRKIFALAKEGGIHLIDTAESYHCQKLIKTEATGFCIYTKTRDWKVNLDWGNNELRGILYHYGTDEKQIELPFIHRWVNLGASVYNVDQLPDERTRIVQVPFHMDNTFFKGCFEDYRTVFVRSVFNRGELLKAGYSVFDCLQYVKQFRPDGVIVGVKSAKELNQILKAWGA